MFDHSLDREVREGFCLLDPPHVHRNKVVAVAWRLAREAAHQRGLFNHPADRLVDLARLSPSPWETPFTYEQRPAFARLREFLDQAPQPLLPALTTDTEPYFSALAGPIQLLSTPSGRIGACFLPDLRPSADEVLDFEEELLTQFSRDANSEGLQEAKVRARFMHGFIEREVLQLMAMHVRLQADALQGVDKEALVRLQVIELDRLASRMSSGLAPDLRGAAMARREIARLLRPEAPGGGFGEGGLLPAAPLARIAEENGRVLPPRRIPVRAEPSDDS